MTKWNGLERTEIKRGTLRSWNSSIASKSAKRKREDRERGKFVADMLARFPGCQIKSPICTGRATQVHEAVKRSQRGAILPGHKAEAQGQEFFTSCTNCNVFWVEGNPAKAREMGFTKSNPLRGQKIYGDGN